MVHEEKRHGSCSCSDMLNIWCTSLANSSRVRSTTDSFQKKLTERSPDKVQDLDTERTASVASRSSHDTAFLRSLTLPGSDSRGHEASKLQGKQMSSVTIPLVSILFPIPSKPRKVVARQELELSFARCVRSRRVFSQC